MLRKCIQQGRDLEEHFFFLNREFQVYKATTSTYVIVQWNLHKSV